ncbi:MAG: DUF4886 domain-containing protein [Prevotellaceae bacterium]|nr:DUF4886 domain-containing protein [Prevotellaceae bacterium]
MKRVLLVLVVCLQAIVGFADNWIDFAVEPAKNSDGAYVITKAEELAWVAKQNLTDAFTDNLVIANDIDLSGKLWTPLGYNGSTTSGATGKYFNGSIDGQGHTIKGMDLQTATDDFSAGLIGGMASKTAVIKNLNLEGTMVINATSKGADFGTLIGFANALATVENCHSSVNITTTGKAGSYMGGLIGRCKATNIIGCSYSGTITVPAGSQIGKGLGGILGTPNSSTSGAKGSVKNSVFCGTINANGTIGASGSAGLVGYANLSKGEFTIANNYVNGVLNFTTSPTNNGVIVGQVTGIGSQTIIENNYVVGDADAYSTKVTADQLHSGELCYMLNNGGHAFTQDLSNAESTPMPIAGKNVYKTTFMVDSEVYASGYNNETITFPTDPEKPDYSFNGWFDAAEEGNKVDATTVADKDMTLYAQFTEVPKDIWDGTTLTEPQKNEQGVYVITTGAELAWIAAESNKGVYAESIIIDKNIDLGGKLWTPIGQDNYYNGSIDGQGHYIKGLYIRPEGAVDYTGLVGQMNSKTASISDLTIYGEMILPETTSNNSVGSLIGFANALGKVTNCHSFVNVTDSTANGGYLGGLAGRVKATTFEGCSYEGTLTIASGASFTKGWGGIVGTFNSTTSGATGGLSNSWMSGTITCESTADYKYKGALVGYPALTKGTCTIENNYAISEYPAFGAAAGTTVANNNFTLAATDSYATQTTMDQIHSGELCHMLGEAFGQNLKDAESYPVARTEKNQVFEVSFMVEDTLYAATYTNGKVVLPAEPVNAENPFIGWYDQATAGTQFTAESVVTSDTTLYAHFYAKDDDVIRILGIGNSFTMDALQSYFAPICKSGGKKVIFGWPYIGGTSLSDHVNNLKAHAADYKYYKNVDYNTTTKGNSEMMTAIKDEPWDYVVIQQSHYDGGVEKSFYPYITELLDSVKANVNNPALKVVVFSTWADDEGCTKANFETYYGRDQIRMYEAVRDAYIKVADSIHADLLIPAGTSVQNCRTTYIGQNMTRDGYHMNYDHGRYQLSLVWYETIFGESALTIDYKPSTISDNMAELLKNAVHYACLKPFEITDMSKEWGVNPDMTNKPLNRPVNISFDSKRNAEYGGTTWNAVTNPAMSSVLEYIVDNKLGQTSVNVTMNTTMTGDYTDGAAETTTDWTMPQEVSQTAFISQGDTAQITIAGLYPDQAYDLGFFGSYKSDETLTTKYVATGETSDSVSIDIANNASTIVWAKQVKADLYGRIFLSILSEEGKTYAINAMQIVPNLKIWDKTSADSISLDPNEGIPAQPIVAEVWDGTTAVEPLKGSNEWYIVTSGDELAWIAKQTSEATFGGNVLITKDIDLGNKKWTPIGLGNSFNGNINGGGHAIKNLYLNPAAADVNTGLIGQTNSTSVIKDLSLYGKMEITTAHTGSNADYGTLVGLANALALVENVHSYVDITIADGADAAYIGGIAGRVKGTNFLSCSYNGTFTIAATGKVSSGWAGLVGTFNSNTTKTGGMNGCWFNGKIDAQNTSTVKYGAAICGYPRLYKSVCTIKNCYAAGEMTVAKAPNNYGIIYGTFGSDGQGESTCQNNYNVGLTATGSAESVKPIDATVEQMNSGELCYLLNEGNTTEPLYYQNIDNGQPVDLNPIADKTHGIVYMIEEGLYSNNPDTPTGINEVQGSKYQVQGSAYNLQGVRVGENYKGIVIKDGKKYLVK